MFQENVCLNLDVIRKTPLTPTHPETHLQFFRNRDNEIIMRAMAILESSLVDLEVLREIHLFMNQNFSKICRIISTEDKQFLEDLKNLKISHLLGIEKSNVQNEFLTLDSFIEGGHYLNANKMKLCCSNFKKCVKDVFLEFSKEVPTDTELASFLREVSYIAKQHADLFLSFNDQLVLTLL